MGDTLEAGQVADGARASDYRLGLTVDLDRKAIGGTVVAPVRLRQLLASLPGAVADEIRDWVPDLALDRLTLGFEPEAGSFGAYIQAGEASSADPAATLVLGSVPLADGTATVVGLGLGSHITLGATPLFGRFLDGICLNSLGLEYASADVPAGALILPPPAPPQPAFKAGLQLAVTIADGSSEQSFVLVPGGARDEPHQLLAEKHEPPAVQWFAVGKAFGPLTVARIGTLTGDDRFGLVLDASVATPALSVGLTGFTLTFPKADISPKKLSVALDGLAVAIATGSFVLSGGLVRKVAAVDVYDGAVTMQIGRFGIAAIGSYADVAGAPSLFVFGVAEGTFGGPPAFYVTGLAAGFGYNRALRLPRPAEVATFPFVQAAAGGSGPSPSPQTALGALDAGGWAPPRVGDYWVAAGVRFTSFDLVHSFALLVVELGERLTLALLGVAALQLPKEGEGAPFAYAELEIDAVLEPTEGTFQLTALLTNNSYVLDPACKLTGGFAFDLWFGSSPHAGDFVVTLGGYNPHFVAPDWYPSVPRLAFDWHMSSQLEVRGTAYFAITPSCAMGGGTLALTYDAGDLHAWFTATADLVVFWRPFYFVVEIGVSVGASYTLDLGLVRQTFSVSLSADLQLWGPPIAGVAHISWWVISFSVDINGGGSPNLPGNTLPDWDTFAGTFLPKGEGRPAALRAARDPLPASPICRARAAAGLVGSFQDGNDVVWRVDATFALATETVIPASSVALAGPAPMARRLFNGPRVGVYPLGSFLVDSPHSLTVVRWANGKPDRTPVDLSSWTWSPVAGNTPESLWGTHNSGTPELAATVIAGLVGLTGTPGTPALSGPDELALTALQYENLPSRALPLPTAPPIDGSTSPTDPAKPPHDARQVIADTIATDPAKSARLGIVAALTRIAVGVPFVSGELAGIAGDVAATFQAPPMLGPLGTTGPAAVTVPARRAVKETPRRSARPRRQPRSRLSAVFRTGEGPGCRAYVADAVLHPNLRHALRHVASPRPDATAAWLEPGTTLLFSLAPGEAPTVQGDGSLPLRLTVFDRQHALLDDVVLAPDHPGYDIPRDADLVALSGLAGVSEPRLVGWAASSRLLQLAPQAFLGEDVVLRPQSPIRLRRRRGTSGTGATTGRALVDGNRTLDGEGVATGWIETTFPAWVETLLLPTDSYKALAFAFRGDRLQQPQAQGTVVLPTGEYDVYAVSPGSEQLRVRTVPGDSRACGVFGRAGKAQMGPEPPSAVTEIVRSGPALVTLR